MVRQLSRLKKFTRSTTNLEILTARSSSTCELCGATDQLEAFTVEPKPGNHADEMAMRCQTCRSQIEAPGTADSNHWRCLNESMWSEVPAVKVLAWRMLTQLQAQALAPFLVHHNATNKLGTQQSQATMR